MRRCVIIEEEENVLMGDRRVGGTPGESEVALLLCLNGMDLLCNTSSASACTASVNFRYVTVDFLKL